MSRHALLLVVSLASLSNLQLASADPLYEIKDLTPTDYSSSVAYDINSSGDAVGIAGRFVGGSLEEAYFFYDHSEGTSTVFGVGAVLPRDSGFGSGFRAAAINDSGQIAGTARFVGGSLQRRGFIYSGGVSGSFTDLGVLAGATATGIRPESDALDINDSGIATGTATSGAGTINTEGDNIDVYTGSASPITDIDGDITVATRQDRGRAINNAGLVVGSNEDSKATLFSGPTETLLLAGTIYADDPSEALDINEAGQVAGSTTATNKAFRYNSSDSSVTIIPQIGTGARMNAKAINEDGDVVGHGDRDGGLSGQARGYVYLEEDATSYILEDHVFDLTVPAVPGLGDWGILRTAWGINDDGWIVGEGERRFEGATFPTNRAYLLIPTTTFAPEDLNMDGFVDGLDLGILLGNWSATVDPKEGELNGTPPVDGLDLGILLGAWNPPAAIAVSRSVPEPGTLYLLAALALQIACNTRHHT